MNRKKLQLWEKKLKVAEKEKQMLERKQKRKVALEDKARKDAEKTKRKLQNEQKKTEKFTQLQKELHTCTINDDTSEGETRCPVCGAVYEEDKSDSLWIGCDNCDLWYCLKCTDVSVDNIADVYHCDRC